MASKGAFAGLDRLGRDDTLTRDEVLAARGYPSGASSPHPALAGDTGTLTRTEL